MYPQYKYNKPNSSQSLNKSNRTAIFDPSMPNAQIYYTSTKHLL